MNFLSVFLIFQLSTADISWVLKVGTETCSLQSFKDHINFMRLQSGLGPDALADPGFVNSCYEDFINFRILLKESTRGAYKESMPQAKKAYAQQKDDWLMGTFVTAILPKPSIDESALRKYFDNLKKSGKTSIPKTTTYDVLSAEEKQTLYQSLAMERASVERQKYSQDLEKLYKVRRLGNKGVHCALLGDTRISTASVRESMGRKFEMMGVDIEDLEKNKIEYQKYFEMELSEILFRTMVQKEMQTKKYLDKPDVKSGLEYLKKQILVSLYIRKEIQEKISVTSKEKDQEYNLRKAQLEGRPFDEVNRYLESSARERKSAQVLSQFLADKKEQYIVKRNRDLIKSYLDSAGSK